MAKSKPLKQRNFSLNHLVLTALVFGLVGGLVGWAAFAAPHNGGGGGSTNITSFSNVMKDLQYPVEQESPNFFYCGGAAGPIDCAFDQSTWVKNPTTCIWDVDDTIQDRASGIFQAGSTVTDNNCLINDGLTSFGYHHVSATIYAPTPNLKLTFSNDKGLRKDAALIQTGNKTYKYTICLYDNTPGPYPSVTDSNGGNGTAVKYDLTATNPTQHDYSNVTILMTMGSNFIYDPGCTSVLPSLSS